MIISLIGMESFGILIYADAIGMDLINEIGMIKLKCPFKYDKKIKRPICWNISCDECWRNALEQEGE